jgi:ABC-type transport system, involved in lipoprotein release, permease component
MATFSSLLAWRFVAGIKTEKNISFMIKVCFVSIVVGTFALALVAAVMNGFERATHKTLQGVHADIIMKAHGMGLDYEKLRPIILTEFKKSIAAVAPNAISHALIMPENDNGVSTVSIVLGIDPVAEAQVTSLGNALLGNSLLGAGTLAAMLAHPQALVIGKTLAQSLDVGVSDSIDLLYMPEDRPSGKKVVFERAQTTVYGLFNTGVEEFDAHVMLCAMPFFQKLFPDAQITQINIKVQPHQDVAVVIQQLQERFPQLDIYSWKDLYPALVAALILEKYAMFFILALITLVASMNIISLLFMYITQKQNTIAILKAMGASDNAIAKIFIFLGMGVSIVGAGFGLLLAVGASWVLETYPFIQLPDVYYVSHLPAHMTWQIMMAVLVLVSVLSFFASWLPARRIRFVRVAHLLKFGV